MQAGSKPGVSGRSGAHIDCVMFLWEFSGPEISKKGNLAILRVFV